ncbi:Mitochondrial distribution and morphology protein 10 [Marasmius crinis-equi]|uniref:Mitochondrial distribution and morphology protein 10 n=1 Tax=Marasmius crinis-equi TaxID=585013 RepID=A0ABR3FGL5_9AGAR
MHPFASYVLRTYYKATGWNEDNLFTNLTRSSDGTSYLVFKISPETEVVLAILDFTVPNGIHLSMSKSPNSLFKTTYSMNAIPSLNGSVGYIFTSCDLDIKSSGHVPFKNMIERFKVYDRPRRPEGKGEEWLAGERVDTRDYLMYGRLYIPTGRLDALYSTRLSPTLQAVVAAISDPLGKVRPDIRGRGGDMSNLMVYLQHDVGKWCTEYSWSAEDSMWGIKVLHNFGRLGGTTPTDTEANSHATTSPKVKVKRIDEEDAIEGGLKGRVCAGAEVYFSAKERSAGISTGVRFTTIPDATPPSYQIPPPSTSALSAVSVSKNPPSQSPTTITALFNPMLGHLSGAYSARVSDDLSLSSRFDFNVYSYESEWTMGAEYWLRRNSSLEGSTDTQTEPEQGGKKPIHGVVKARASTSNDVSIMWEGRIRNMLVSLGVVSDFSSRLKPIKSMGLELSYFSSDN